MAANVMSLDTERVSASLNRISILIADIETRTHKFVELVREKNEATDGKFVLVKTLENKLSEESQNIANIGEAQQAIMAALNRYTDLADEVNDDSALL